MPGTNKRKWPLATVRATTPLSVAVAGRDGQTLNMVRDALRHRQTVLAYQPVMQAEDASKPAFYEGLIRVIDRSGRIIPAQDFMPLVEETELGREIDVSALRMGLTALAGLRHQSQPCEWG